MSGSDINAKRKLSLNEGNHSSQEDSSERDEAPCVAAESVTNVHKPESSSAETLPKKQKLESVDDKDEAEEVAPSQEDADMNSVYESDNDPDNDEDSEFSYSEEEEEELQLNDDDVAKKLQSKHKGYKVLSPKEICEYMARSIDEANEVLQLPLTTMRMLLNHFGWDNEKLMVAYYGEEQEKLFKDASVVNPFIEQTPEAGAGVDCLNKCQVCDEEVDESLLFGLTSCINHRFCIPCWRQYLTMKIVDEGMGQTISCPGHNCPILVDDATVMQLVTDTNVIQKYQQLITNSFVQCNRLMRWCPSPDCNKAILSETIGLGPVTCSCSFTFCFQCGHKNHDPLKCVWLKKWLKKCADDSETANWISANTKECPNGNCTATIEKNGGCNHMHCRKCGHHFCWICLGDWKAHGTAWYQCNRYNSGDAEAARKAQDNSRAALQRYLFYFNRYMNHMESFKFESKLYSSIKDKMNEIQKYFNMTWIEVQFLNTAVDVLCQCRQTLTYTYAFAFYLEKNNQTVIFEDNQRDLETATETLSEYLERDITVANMADIQQRVQDKTRYCEQRRNVLLNHVHEGYQKRTWVFKEKEKD